MIKLTHTKTGKKGKERGGEGEGNNKSFCTKKKTLCELSQ
jgi:hypothetical protein